MDDLRGPLANSASAKIRKNSQGQLKIETSKIMRLRIFCIKSQNIVLTSCAKFFTSGSVVSAGS